MLLPNDSVCIMVYLCTWYIQYVYVMTSNIIEMIYRERILGVINVVEGSATKALD